MRKSSRLRSDNPAADNIKAVATLEEEVLHSAPLSERVAHELSKLVAKAWFVVVQLMVILSWVVWNSFGPEGQRFDPYPYFFLSFLVGLEGVMIATCVLIAQNRLSRQSDQREHLHLQINLLAEQEMTVILKLLRRVADRLEVTPESAEDARAEQFAEDTDIRALVKGLRQEFLEREKK